MTDTYGSFYCKVCGELMLLPLDKSSTETSADANPIELTCSSGHTDSYTTIRFEKHPPSSLRPPKVRRAIAGLG